MRDSEGMRKVLALDPPRSPRSSRSAPLPRRQPWGSRSLSARGISQPRPPSASWRWSPRARSLAGSSAIVASLLSFLGLNFFFTEPHHTLAVRHASDVVALIAFLLSGFIVGALVSRVREERSRAERRATEALFLNRTTERFISSGSIDRIARRARGGAPGLLRARELRHLHSVGVGRADADEQGAVDGDSDLDPARHDLGIVRCPDRRPRGGSGAVLPPELGLLKTLAAQTALAIERASLDGEVREARLAGGGERAPGRAVLLGHPRPSDAPRLDQGERIRACSPRAPTYSDEERRDVLRTVVEEADHLNLIVGNLLDLARMRAGALVPAKQPILDRRGDRLGAPADATILGGGRRPDDDPPGASTGRCGSRPDRAGPLEHHRERDPLLPEGKRDPHHGRALALGGPGADHGSGSGDPASRTGSASSRSSIDGTREGPWRDRSRTLRSRERW